MRDIISKINSVIHLASLFLISLIHFHLNLTYTIIIILTFRHSFPLPFQGKTQQ